MDTYNHFQYADALVRSLKLFSTGLDRSRKVLFTSPNSDSLYSVSQRLGEINYPIMVAVNGFDADYADYNSDALFEKSQFFFMILMPALMDNPEDILSKQEICKRNAMQIQARLIHDSRKYLNGLENLLINTFTIRSIGPMGTGLFGVIMGFNVEDNIEYYLKNEYWKA